MWRTCGIVRRRSELLEALAFTTSLQLEAQAVLANAGVNTEAQELVNLATVASLVAACALQRRESRGGHYVLDYPEPVESQRRPSVVSIQELAPEYEVPPARLASSKGRLAPSNGNSSRVTGGGGSKKVPGTTGSKKVSTRELVIRSLPQEDK
jgi:L-aspartate oxidase